MTEQTEISWDDILPAQPFLRASNVEEPTDTFKIIAVDKVKSELSGEEVLRLYLEIHDEKYIFDCNKTNAAFLKQKFASPSEAVGKNIRFKVVLVRNPKTKEEVDSLRISEVVE